MLAWLRARFGREARMKHEFEFHLEMEVERNIRAGLTPAEAKRQARLAFGGEDRMAEVMRDESGVRWLVELAQDARYALRTLNRSRAFAAVAIVTVILGVGATSVVFGVGNQVLLRAVTAPDRERLYTVEERRSGAVSQPMGETAIPWSRYQAYESATGGLFTGLASHRPATFSMRVRDATLPAYALLVSGNYFEVLGHRPVAGRFFSANDEAVVVLSERFWRTQFGGDRSLIGASVYLNGKALVVGGIAPRGFEGTMVGMLTDLWVPLPGYYGPSPSGWDTWVVPFGRLRGGVEAGQAAAQLEVVAKRIPPDEPQTRVHGVRFTRMSGLPAFARGPVIGFFGLLLAAALLVLVIAAANIAGVLLGRAMARRREIGVRLAIGAGRGRVVRQLLTESVVLFLIGGSGGVLLSIIVVRALKQVRVPGLYAELAASVDWRVCAAALAVAALTGTVFALLPALQATRHDLISALRTGRQAGQPGRSRGRNLFVGAQLAVSVLLLVVAGLFVRTVRFGLDIDPGFDAKNVVIGSVAPHGYDEARGRIFFERLRERLEALPGIESVALAQRALVAVENSSGDIEPVDARPGELPRVNAIMNTVDSAYFTTMRVPLIAGRGFRSGDRSGGARVAVINELVASTFWPGESALGRRIRHGRTEFEVVGVTRTGKYTFLSEQPKPFMFLSYEQSHPGRVTLHVRTKSGEGETIARMREELRALDPDIALQDATALLPLNRVTVMPQRVAAYAIGTFGVIGLLLAALGVYGVLAFHVTQRTPEFGIRIALGASARDISRLVLGSATGLTITAVLIGLAVAAVATRFLRGLIFGVSTLDPVTFIGVPILLAAVALLASWIPARRALRITPLEALRVE